MKYMLWLNLLAALLCVSAAGINLAAHRPGWATIDLLTAFANLLFVTLLRRK